MHKSVEVVSKQMAEQLKRICHVTPTSYLELLFTLQKLLGWKKTEI